MKDTLIYVATTIIVFCGFCAVETVNGKALFI